MIKFDILNRWTRKPQFTAEINCDEGASRRIKVGLSLAWAYKHGAVLSGADLRGADLRGADLSDAPAIPEIHKAVYAAASAPGALDMSKWHCGTTHCRAGWVVTLAGKDGVELERRIGTPAAAALIYLKSDPHLERMPDFYCGNEAALEDMKRLAEQPAEGDAT